MESGGWRLSSWRRAETTSSTRSSRSAPGQGATVRVRARGRLPPAGENPAEDPDWEVGVEDVLALPYYEGSDLGSYPELDSGMTMYYDRVPKGEVEVRRASAVISSDGHSLGEVDGFVVDADKHITHFVLERGHLWGRKEVTIPIGAVARVESDAVHVALSKDEVGALPAVHVGRHG